MDTLLVTGSNGLLGTKLLKRARGMFNVVGSSQRPANNLSAGPFEFRQADIRDATAVSRVLNEVRPHVVVHTAAMTNVDACELQPALASEINVNGTENVVNACKQVDAQLVFISTDYVFSGDTGPYDEEAATEPLSVYGKTKLAAEQLVQHHSDYYCIARTSTLYGYTPAARPNFVTWLLAELRAGNPVAVVTDQVSSPTLADNLAEMVLALAAKDAKGLFHTAGAEWLSRYDFALKIASCFSLDAALIKPGNSEEVPQAAPRPHHSGLLTHRLTTELGVHPLTVEEGLLAMRAQMEAFGR